MQWLRTPPVLLLILVIISVLIGIVFKTQTAEAAHPSFDYRAHSSTLL